MNWILFSFILFCVGAFGVAWRSWARPAGRLRTRASGYVSDHSARLANSAVHRLFSAADEQFAARFGKQIARRLRRNRRYAMNLYLGQLRREFQSAARVARDAAAHSDTPADAMKILRLSVEFYTLQALLYAQAYLGRRVVSTEPLLRRMVPLRRIS